MTDIKETIRLHQNWLDDDIENPFDRVRADFTNQDLHDFDLSHTNLMGAIFTGDNLTGVNFEGATLDCADFTDANLDGANFENASLVLTVFTNANITPTTKVKLPKQK